MSFTPFRPLGAAFDIAGAAITGGVLLINNRGLPAALANNAAANAAQTTLDATNQGYATSPFNLQSAPPTLSPDPTGNQGLLDGGQQFETGPSMNSPGLIDGGNLAPNQGSGFDLNNWLENNPLSFPNSTFTNYDNLTPPDPFVPPVELNTPVSSLSGGTLYASNTYTGSTIDSVTWTADVANPGANTGQDSGIGYATATIGDYGQGAGNYGLYSAGAADAGVGPA